MPIVASKGSEIRRLLQELSDPKRRTGAAMRLRALGARVVPHVADELGRLDASARRALVDALKDVNTAEGRALKDRLVRSEGGPEGESMTPAKTRTLASEGDANHQRGGASEAPGAEASAMNALQALPPLRPNERATISRERGEAHLALARLGSRLARKDLLLGLTTLGAGRTRLYCEAAGLIGDVEFLAPLARLAEAQPGAARAVFDIAARDRITARSKVLLKLDESLRPIIARCLIGR
jgi:hypothetical protein